MVSDAGARVMLKSSSILSPLDRVLRSSWETLEFLTQSSPSAVSQESTYGFAASISGVSDLLTPDQRHISEILRLTTLRGYGNRWDVDGLLRYFKAWMEAHGIEETHRVVTSVTRFRVYFGEFMRLPRIASLQKPPPVEPRYLIGNTTKNNMPDQKRRGGIYKAKHSQKKQKRRMTGITDDLM